MMLEAAAIAALLCAALPAVLFCANLRLYRPPPAAGPLLLPMVSVLIPARDEANSITPAVATVLASTGVAFEVVVMDDGSTDGTAAIVEALALADRRVRLEHAPSLPAGWNGKQHACWALAHAAKGDVLCFMDADVRPAPEAVSRMAAFLMRRDAALVSGFPRQITQTWMEWLLLPLIHFVLLGFLPIARMRQGTDPSLAAGCGQFMMVRRADYFAAGGHAAIRRTMHDGLLLPRLLRQSGRRTDLADLTGLVVCRMYANARQVWQGLAKNATEGLAAPARILPVSLLLALGQVAPFGLGILLWLRGASLLATLTVAVAIACAWLPRVLAAARFRQDWRSALLHPFGIATLLAVQWYALTRQIAGAKVSWKERSYLGR
jgi:hypothetical protein